jgi:hypothetical protein
LSSVSYFSFWFRLVAVCTWMRETMSNFCHMSSNASTPSFTFFRVLSISPNLTKKNSEMVK